MRTLVIGYGSIGARHVRLLEQLSCQVAVVSKRAIDYQPSYKSLGEALNNETPEYIVIGNQTSEHYTAIEELASLSYNGKILVEKPLFDRMRDMPANSFKNVYVAYNLRFHPIVQKLRELLKHERIISVQVYAGQYLPQWRPGTDYTSSYSVSRSAGGGVLRDLSHEIDYLNWLLEGWSELVAQGGHYSNLKINSDDVFMILMKTERCPLVLLQLNYLDRRSRREIIVNTDNCTLKADLVDGLLCVDGFVEKIKTDRDYTYLCQHQAILTNNVDTICTLEEGLEVLRILEAAEESARTGAWVKR